MMDTINNEEMSFSGFQCDTKQGTQDSDKFLKTEATVEF